jgi:hypothetical protein
MFNSNADPTGNSGSTLLGRRDILKVGAAVATAPLLAGVARGAEPDTTKAAAGDGPTSARDYGATRER